METALLVDGAEDGGLGTLLGGERGGEVKLETLGNLVLELDGVAEDVGGGPGLGDGEAVGLVGPLTLEVTGDDVGLAVLVACDLEGDVGRGDGLDLEGGAVEGVLLVQEVIGGLAKVLWGMSEWGCSSSSTMNSPSRKGERVEGETF